MTLTSHQAAAVASDAKVTVVRAGPGSGKTRVIVERARRAVREGDRPTLIAFTRSAAREMIERLGDDAAGVAYCGTLHGLCATVLHDCPKHLPDGISPGQWHVASPQSIEIATKQNVDPKASGLLGFDELFRSASAIIEAGHWTCPGLLLVDECQDLTAPEWALVDRLSARRFLVGDVAQAIFGWRGGRPDLLVHAPGTRQPRMVLDLIDNFRSTASVVEVVNRIPVEGRVAVRSARGPGESSPAVVGPSEALAILADVGTPTAVLARTKRSLRFARRQIEDCGIKTWAPVLADDVWSTKGGLLVLAAVHVLANPHDSLHFAHVLTAKGVSASELAFAEVGRARRACSLWAWWGDDDLAAVLRIGRLDHMLTEIVEWIYGWETPDDVVAARDLAARWYREAPSGSDSARDFLEWFADPYREPVGQAERPDGVVELHTIHGAKGREWSRVVVWDCVDGVLPILGRRTDLDEERRLFYVAASRARDELIFVVPDGADASRFLREVGLAG